LLLSIVSTFSSANGFICWFVLAPILFRSKSELRNWRAAIWLIGLLLSGTVYSYSFQKPSYTPSLSTVLYHPLQGLYFFCSFLGAPLMTSNRLIFISFGLGALLLTLFVLSFFFIWKSTDDAEFKYRAIGWLMLGSYSFLTAMMVTVARLGFGAEQALSSRYITFSVYLLISLVYLIPLIVDQAIKRDEFPNFKFKAVLSRVAVAVLIFLHVANSAAAIRQMAWMKTRRLEAKACLLFINVVPNQCLSHGFPELSVLRARVNDINKLGYLRPGLIGSSNIKEIAGPNPPGNNSLGRLETVVGTNGTFAVNGWASLSGGKEAADAVLLTYEKDQSDPTVFAYAQMKIGQPSFKRLMAPDPAVDWRWQTSISINGAGVTLPISVSAWAFDATTGKAHKLAGTYLIHGNGSPPQLIEAQTR